MPLFLVALLVVRGVPALLYARTIGRRRAAAGGLLQATTLTFVIVATEIGLETGKLTPTTSAALVAAGLLSAALFPAGAARLLAPRGRDGHRTAPAAGIDGLAGEADGIDGLAAGDAGIDGPAEGAAEIDGLGADAAGIDGPAVPAQPKYSPGEVAVPED